MPLFNFSGIASGIDTEGLIKATIDAQRQVRITPSEDRVSELEDTNQSLRDLKSRLDELQTLLDPLRTINGGGVAKSLVSTDETNVSGTATNAASVGSYNLNVTSVAKNATLSFSRSFSSTSEAIGPTINDATSDGERTVTFYVGSASEQETVAVTLTSTTTAAQFVTQFNANSTNAVASIINTGSSLSPSYKIVVSSIHQGLAKGELQVFEDPLATEITPSMLDLVDANTNVSQAANAVFTVQGISGTITRATNSVTDVIPGVNLSINDTGSAVISVNVDTTATISTIRKFIDGYNDIVRYIAEQNTVERQEDGADVDNVFAPLATTRVDDNALTALRSAISGTRYLNNETTPTNSIRILADLGITTQRDGTLKFDEKSEDTLEAALASEPTSVTNILSTFADKLAQPTSGIIAQFTGFNRIFDITINANTNSISNLNRSIERAEAQLTAQEASLRARFAALESLIGRLQQQQSSLTSALSGLSG